MLGLITDRTQSNVDRLNDLAQKSNRTRNELINILLDYAMKECEIEED